MNEEEFVAHKPENDYDYGPIVPAKIYIGVLRDIGLLSPEDFQGNRKYKPKVRFYFQLNVQRPDKPELPYTSSKKYTNSLAANSHLYKDLKSWFGKEPPDSFDLQKLIGHCCQIQIIHNDGTDREGKPTTYANIETILPLVEGMPNLTIDPNYVRLKDRDDFKGWPDQSALHTPPSISDAVASRANYEAPSNGGADPVVAAGAEPRKKDELPF